MTLNNDLYSIYLDLFRNIFKREKTFVFDGCKVKLISKHGDKYKFDITKKKNFRYIYVKCGHEPLIVEITSGLKVVCGNDYAVVMMYTLLFSLPLNSTLIPLQSNMKIYINDPIKINNTNQKSFTCKMCFRMVLGTVSICKSLCSGGCGKFEVSPSPDISIHLFKNESDNFYERLYRALCEKFKHVSKKEAIEYEKNKVKTLINDSPHFDPTPLPHIQAHKDICTDLESLNIINSIFEEWFDSIMDRHIFDSDKLDATNSDDPLTPTNTDSIPPPPDLSIQDKQRHFQNILNKAELQSTLPTKNTGDKKKINKDKRMVLQRVKMQ